jgi:hypothetical protein
MRSIYPFSALNPVERKILDLIRRTAAGEPAEDKAGCFSALSAAALGQGSLILPPGAVALAPDEVILLRWLARYQRQTKDYPEPSPVELDEALFACVVEMGNRSWRLPFLTTQRRVPTEDAGERPAAGGRHPLPLPAPPNGRQQAIAELASRHRVVSIRDCKRLGISQQYLTSLCRAGLLVRTGIGLYRMPD